MELGLQFEEITAYETVETQAITHEETLETAIPEYCPDIGRVVDTVGQLCIREKLLAEDYYMVSGAVKVTVLYTSEETAGLKSLTLSVPFSCRMEEGGLKSCKTVCVTGRLLMLEAKAVTSRRLYLRVLPEISGIGFRAVQRKLCCGTEEEASIRLRRKKVTLPLMTGAEEQEFTFSGETMVEDKMPEELLFYRLCGKVSGTQRIGNKLMVKGEICLCTLYRTAESLLERYETSLPFSQIVEAYDLPEQAHHVVTPRICEGDARLLRTEAGGGFGVTAHIALCIRTYEELSVDCVEDLYSTRYEAVSTQEGVGFPTCYPPTEILQETTIQTEVNTRQAFVTNLECTQAAAVSEENHHYLRTNVNIHLLYTDEDGTPVSVEASQEVSIPAENPPTAVSAVCGMETLQCGGVCLLRVPVTFRMEGVRQETVSVITALKLEEEETQRKAPSLVLRRLRENETLWDVAKQYRTDEETIRQVNPEEDGKERMLLIPRIR